MVWWPFAPKPERADTLEVTDLHSNAPPLYSTVKRSSICDCLRQSAVDFLLKMILCFPWSRPKNVQISAFLPQPVTLTLPGPC